MLSIRETKEVQALTAKKDESGGSVETVLSRLHHQIGHAAGNYLHFIKSRIHVMGKLLCVMFLLQLNVLILGVLFCKVMVLKVRYIYERNKLQRHDIELFNQHFWA